MLSKLSTCPFQIESLESRTLLNASLVKDFNTASGDSALYSIGSIDNWAIFAREDLEHGVELWRSNGTGGGTTLLKDLLPGADGSYPEFRASAGKLVYFSATIDSRETFWRTDGTANGTFRLRTLHTDSEYAVRNDGQLFFFARDPSHGYELWTSDGTGEGTYLVKDIHPGKKSGAYGSLVSNGGSWINFAADDGEHGTELWRSDGTSAGTAIINDLTPGAVGSYLRDFIATTNRIYFKRGWVKGDQYGTELWTSDGESSVGKISDEVSDVASLGNTLYFGKGNGSLWRTDGSVEGNKRLLKSGFDEYFVAQTVTPKTDRLFSSNFIIRGDRATKRPGIFSPYHQIGNTLYGVGYQSDEVWRSDGSANGTYAVVSIKREDFSSPYVGWFYSGKSQVFFVTSTSAYDYSGSDDERWADNLTLWKTDGTLKGTKELKYFDAEPQTGLFYDNYFHPFVVNDTLYFDYFDSQTGTQLWKSDGTPSSTRPLRDDYFRTAGSFPDDITPGVGGTYFTTYHPPGVWVKPDAGKPVQLLDEEGKIVGDFKGKMLLASDHALWLSDGTKKGTVKFFDLPVRQDEYFDLIVDTEIVGQRINFKENAESFYDYVFYVSDGTRKGTHEVSSEADQFHGTQIGNGLVYVDEDTSKLVRTDLEGKNRQVLATGVFNNEPLYEFNGQYYLADVDKLWRTDGTRSGTKKLMDLDDDFPELAGVGKALFVQFEKSLWTIDTLTGKKHELLRFKAENDRLGFLEATDSRVFFSTATAKYGTELWTSDGTVIGTKLVKDIWRGNASALLFPYETEEEGTRYSLSATAASGTALYFTVNDGSNNVELWQSDGTSSGTARIDTPARLDDWAPEMRVVGSTLYFTGDDKLHGFELWQLSLQ